MTALAVETLHGLLAEDVQNLLSHRLAEAQAAASAKSGGATTPREQRRRDRQAGLEPALFHLLLQVEQLSAAWKRFSPKYEEIVDDDARRRGNVLSNHHAAVAW